MAIGGIKPVVEIMFGIDFVFSTRSTIESFGIKYEWMYDNKVTVPVTIRTTIGARRGYGPTHGQSLEPILSSMQYKNNLANILPQPR